MPQIFTSDGREVLSASFLYEEWGVASGNLVMIEPASPGEKITVERGGIPLFTGVVTKVRYIHEDNEYRAEIKDPVSAILSGEAEFDGGEIGAVLGGILSSLDCSFSGTSDIELFGSVEDPVQWVDLIRSVCLATGKVFRYLPDGSYELVSPSSVTAVDPLEAATGIDVDRYANQVVITVDGDWTEDADPTPEVTVETGYGITRTVTKIGEQVQTVVSNLGDGRGVSESWTWDAAGNLTRYDKAETADLEKTTSYTTYTIGTGDSLVIYEESVVERRANPLADWYFYRRYRKTTSTYLDDEAPVQIDEYVDWYFQEENQWHSKEWIRRFGLPKMPGILESSRNEYYEYSETDSLFHLQRTTNEGGLRKPDISKVLQVKKHSVHLSATAADEDSIAALGAVEKTLALHGIADTSVLETAAENYLNYCSRCRSGTFTLPAAPFLIGDFISWNGEEWVIDTAAFNLTSEDVVLECSSIPPFSEIEGALGVDSEDIGTAVVHLLEKKSKRLNNVARATVVAQVDYETYQVRVQGEAAGKTRTARVDYQAGVRFPPGKEVLLGRPTGKGVGWEILTRRRDDPTVVSYIPVSPGIGTSPSITAFTGTPDSGLNSVEVEFTIAFSGEISSQTINYGDKLPLRGELSGTGELPAEGEIGEAFLIGVDRHVWDGSAWRNIGPEMDTLILKGTKVSADDLPTGARKYDIWKVGSVFWYWNGSEWVSAGEAWPKVKHVYVKTKEGEQEFVPSARLGWNSMGVLRSTVWVEGEKVSLVSDASFEANPVYGEREFEGDPLDTLFSVSANSRITSVQIDFGDGSQVATFTQEQIGSQIPHRYYLPGGMVLGEVAQFHPRIRSVLGEVSGEWINLSNGPIRIVCQAETYLASETKSFSGSYVTGGGNWVHYPSCVFSDPVVQGWRVHSKFYLSTSMSATVTYTRSGGSWGGCADTGSFSRVVGGTARARVGRFHLMFTGQGNMATTGVYRTRTQLRGLITDAGSDNNYQTPYGIKVTGQAPFQTHDHTHGASGFVALEFYPPDFEWVSGHVLESSADGGTASWQIPIEIVDYWKRSTVKAYVNSSPLVPGLEFSVSESGLLSLAEPPETGAEVKIDFEWVPVGGTWKAEVRTSLGSASFQGDVRNRVLLPKVNATSAVVELVFETCSFDPDGISSVQGTVTARAYEIHE